MSDLLMKCTKNGGCKFYIPPVYNCNCSCCDITHQHDNGCSHPDQQYIISYIANKCKLLTPKDQTQIDDFIDVYSNQEVNQK